MKKRLYIFIVTFLIALHMVPVLAMEQSEPTSTYKLVHTIKTQYAWDMIAIVKKISDKFLIIFDREGRGELFDLTHGYKRIDEISIDQRTLKNIFLYTDKDNQDLLIAFDIHYIYLWNLACPSSNRGRIQVNHRFDLVRTLDATDDHIKKLLFITTEASPEIVFSIALTWKMVQDKSYYLTIDMLQKNLYAYMNCAYMNNEIYEGLVMHSRNFSRCQFLDNLDSSARTYCYHKTPDGMVYLGHIGAVSIWEQK